MSPQKHTFVVPIIITVAFVVTGIFVLNNFNINRNTIRCTNQPMYEYKNKTYDESTMNFTNFNNEIGTPDGCYIVPNIVHFIRFSDEPVSYGQMICYLAAFRNQKPDTIYFHYDDPRAFTGKYWDIVKNTKGFMDVVKFSYVEMPTEIFGQEFKKRWAKFHGSDVTRIRVLMEYGGIYLDNDCYIVRSLNNYRRYEMTIGITNGELLGNQIFIAHKDARFLKLYLESYRDSFDKNSWYHNSGGRPTLEILNKQPGLVHRENYFFGVHSVMIFKLYKEYWPQWRYMYNFHLLYRHYYMLGAYEKKLPEEFNETNIMNYSITFREMALDVYNPDNVTFEYTEQVFD